MFVVVFEEACDLVDRELEEFLLLPTDDEEPLNVFFLEGDVEDERGRDEESGTYSFVPLICSSFGAVILCARLFTFSRN